MISHQDLDQFWWFGNEFDIEGLIEYSYEIIGTISDKRCSDLAPNIGVDCNKGYLIGVGDYSGGSMGWDMSYGVYGFFDLPNFGPSIVPLKFFQNKNEGLNFLDEN